MQNREGDIVWKKSESIFSLAKHLQGNVQPLESEVAQSCPTLCNPTDCSLPCSSIHWIFQARVLEWVAVSFSRGSFWPSDWTWVSQIVGRCFTIWATREVFWKRCVNLFYSQVGWDKLSLHELNKGTLVYSQAEEQYPPGKSLSMLIIVKASERNSLQHWVILGFFLATGRHG